MKGHLRSFVLNVRDSVADEDLLFEPDVGDAVRLGGRRCLRQDVDDLLLEFVRDVEGRFDYYGLAVAGFNMPHVAADWNYIVVQDRRNDVRYIVFAYHAPKLAPLLFRGGRSAQRCMEVLVSGRVYVLGAGFSMAISSDVSAESKMPDMSGLSDAVLARFRQEMPLSRQVGSIDTSSMVTEGYREAIEGSAARIGDN